MEQKIYFVATENSYSSPSIIEQFNNHSDAATYAALMSRTKKKRYFILEQLSEWDGTALVNTDVANLE